MKIGKIVVAIPLVAIATTLLIASAFAYIGGQNAYGAPANGAFNAYPNGMMGGMMGRAYGYLQANQNSYAYNYGWGCRGRFGYNGYAAPNYANSNTPITINTAVATAQRYLESLNNADLAIAEVEEYTQNFYVSVYEKSTGKGAFEMLIDKYSGHIYPEMGPNMMWNTKYGMMNSGRMGCFSGLPITAMAVTVDQAKANAQQFLDANLLGTTVGDVTAFYGYYRIEVLSAGKTYGMLSVNGYSGQVWYHTWHGNFIQEVEP